MPDPETHDLPNPEPSPEATLRLPVGVPVDPQSTLRMDLPKHLNAHSTQQLPLLKPVADPSQTQKLVISNGDESPIRIQKVDQPAEAEGQTQKMARRPEAPKPFGWKLPLGLCALLALGAVAYLMMSRRPSPQPFVSPVAGMTTPSATQSVPPAAQAYFEQARAGDAHAMRMLGAMYYYGLNVPQDRDKGRYWYRKAAEKGSGAARIELSKIER